jgi:hypothetical protein
LARQTRFVQRTRSKINGFTFLVGLLGGLTCAAPSLESISSHLRIRVSRQAIDQRFNRCTVYFLKSCLELLLQQISSYSVERSSKMSSFSRVLVCDSTHWRLKEKLARTFRGFGGAAPKASCKLQTIIEPLSGKLVHWRYTGSCFPDQGYAKNLPRLLKPMDLLLMDLGYYSMKVFKMIQRKRAFFITRIYSHAVVKTLSIKSDKTTVGRLVKKFSDPLVDLQMIVGSENPMQLRLVAARLTCQKAAAQRRRVKENYRKSGKQAPKERLMFCDWSVLITNIEPSLFLSTQDIFNLYGTRWQIEIFFRDAKSLLRINACRTAKKYRFETELLAILFLACLLFYLYGCFNDRLIRKKQESSFDKIIKRFREIVAIFICLILQQTQQAYANAVSLLMRLLPRSLKFHQTTRKTPRQILISCDLA